MRAERYLLSTKSRAMIPESSLMLKSLRTIEKPFPVMSISIEPTYNSTICRIYMIGSHIGKTIK